MKTLTVPAKIVGGKLELYEQAKFREAIKTWKDSEVEITINYYSSRHSDAQREFYHACVVYNIRAAMVERIGDDISLVDTHEWLKRQFNCLQFFDNSGVQQCVGKSTSRLNKMQFMEYIDKCIQFATEELGIPFERFDTELYKKAKELAEKFGMQLKRPKKAKTV